MLIGADWPLKDVDKKIEEAEKLEIAGGNAKAMKHALIIQPVGAEYISDLYFVETDMDIISELEEDGQGV